MKRKRYATGTGASGVSIQNYMQSPQEALFENDILKAKAEQEALNNPWAMGTEFVSATLSSMASSGDLAKLVNPDGKSFNAFFGGKKKAFGGVIDSPLLFDPIDPPTKKVVQKQNAISALAATTGAALPVDENLAFNTKKIVKYQPGVKEGKTGKSGFYIYSKDPTTPGFNVIADREFINQENMKQLQRTPEWKEFMATQQFAMGGEIPEGEVELEGGEVVKTPTGETVEMQGPKHTQGGIPMDVAEPNAPIENDSIPQNSLVFSDQLSRQGKTIAEREASRTKQEAKLDKMLSASSVDVAVRNTVNRRKKSIQTEREGDIQFQEMAKIMEQVSAQSQQMSEQQSFALGGPIKYNQHSEEYFAPYFKKYLEANPGVKFSLKDFQKYIGLSEKDSKGKLLQGYGQVAGPATLKAAQNKFGILLPPPPNEEYDAVEKLNVAPDGIYKDSDYTPGYVSPYLAKYNPPYVKGGIPAVEPIAETSAEDEGYSPTIGDAFALAGTAYSAFAPMSNTLSNRSSDTLNPDFYENIGEETDAIWEQAQQMIEAQQANALKSASTASTMAKRSGRAGARGINQIRMMDFLANEKENQIMQEIYNNSSAQAAQMLSTQAQMKLQADQLKAMGATAADENNRKDKDAFHTQLAKDIATKGTGIATMGKMLNEIALNPIFEELLKNQGEHVGMTSKAELFAKRRKKTNPKKQ